MDGGAWWATVHGVAKGRQDWVTSHSHTAVVNYDTTRGRWCPRCSQPQPDSAHPGRLQLDSARFFQFKWKAKCRRREPVHGRLLTGESVQGCLFMATGRTQAVESLTGFFLAASHAAWLGLWHRKKLRVSKKKKDNQACVQTVANTFFCPWASISGNGPRPLLAVVCSCSFIAAKIT